MDIHFIMYTHMTTLRRSREELIERLESEYNNLKEYHHALSEHISKLDKWLYTRPNDMQDKVAKQNEVLLYLSKNWIGKEKTKETLKKEIEKQKTVLKHLVSTWCLPAIPKETDDEGLQYTHDPNVFVSKYIENCIYLDEKQRKKKQWDWMTEFEREAYLNGTHDDFIVKHILPLGKNLNNCWVLDVFISKKGKRLCCCWRGARVERRNISKLIVHFKGWDGKYDRILDLKNPIDRAGIVLNYSSLDPDNKEIIKFRFNKVLKQFKSRLAIIPFDIQNMHYRSTLEL